VKSLMPKVNRRTGSPGESRAMRNVIIEIPIRVGIAYRTRRMMKSRKRSSTAEEERPARALLRQSRRYCLIHQVWTFQIWLNEAGSKFWRVFCDPTRTLFA
jgi:hypothetical protein